MNESHILNGRRRSSVAKDERVLKRHRDDALGQAKFAESLFQIAT
jgi:hypothetical protein